MKYVTAVLLIGVLSSNMAAADGNSLKSISEGYFAETFRMSPAFATQMGIHDYDDKLDEVDKSAHEKTKALAEKTLAAVKALDPAQMTPIEQDDRAIFTAYLEGQIREETVIRNWRHNPDQYVGLGLGAVNSLIMRQFDRPEGRLAKVIARENALPKMLRDAKANLADMPPVFIEIATENLDGAITFLQHDVPIAFADVKDARLTVGLAKSTRKASAALAEFRTFLIKEKPRSRGRFALGRDNFIGLLHDDLIEATPEEVLAAGEAQLAKDRAAWDRVTTQIDPNHADHAYAEVAANHPSADKLIESAQSELAALRTFVEDKRIITLPFPLMPKVEETPAFQRAAIFGALDWPGPFETRATESYYYITPPDPKDTPEEQEAFLRLWNYPALQNLSVHEALPGHFVQGLYLKAHPEWSIIRKVIQSYTATEGWAHYSEQMMLDEGLSAGDPQVRLMQLSDALLRDCRLIDSIKMHVQGMSLDEATKMMKERCYIPDSEAYKEARRGTSDPGYFSYTLGKLEILKLREDVRQKEGDKFSLQSFHDRFQSAGLVPINIIRREMLGQDGPGL